MKVFNALLLMLGMVVSSVAQTINVLPAMNPEGGAHNDYVEVECTFPEGCAGGKYWIDGGEILAKVYTEPIKIKRSCKLSIAGISATGRIITDVVSHDFTINRVTPPTYTPSPKEGVRKTNFYVTKLSWDYVTTTTLKFDDFKEGGKRRGEKFIWITDEDGQIVASNDYNGLWMDGTNQFKAYIYDKYNITKLGKYQFHIASGVFVHDGVVYDKEIVLNYEVATGADVPEFSLEPGEYKAPLTVSITYPEDGTSFYKFYTVNGGKRKEYTEPLVLNETTTIQAFGMSEDLSSKTATVTATYTIIEPEKPKDPLANPVITRNDNTITITGPEGATLKYWLNDNMSNAKVYTTPFEVSENGKVACIAYNEEGRKSSTVEYNITGFDVDRGDYGDQILKTPAIVETTHIMGMSPNGRYVTGFTGSDTSSKGFVWDLYSDNFKYASTIYANQLYYVSNDGTAYGWRAPSAELDQETTEEDLIWGICKDGAWTAQPKGFSTKGITGSGLLFGSHNGRPAMYDFVKDEITYYGEIVGSITSVSTNTSLVGGYVILNAKQIPVIWSATDKSTLYAEQAIRDAQGITAISDNGEWAIIGQDFRLNVKTGDAERIISTTATTTNTTNPEVLRTIANDGTIFGTYDSSLTSGERGISIVYTTDSRYRTLNEWMRDEKMATVSGYILTSVRGVTGDKNTIITHAIPLSISEEDAFTTGLAIRNNVLVKHLPPVSLTAESLNGMKTVKLTWSQPISNANTVKNYVIKRNGETLKTVSNTTLVYYDKSIFENTPYTYTVAATYRDNVVSTESEPCQITYVSQKYLPVRNINVRYSGLNDVNLTWDTPEISLPKLQYFNENSEKYAFGTRQYNSEFGIRITASDLEAYAGNQIRTFQFLPTGPQLGYTLNLYRANAQGTGYDPTPFYTQNIDPETLVYGSVNVVKLNEPQELPRQDLYVGLYIKSKGTDDMLGVSFEGFKSGYTDLCRIEGIFESMQPISKNSSQTTEIVLPLGIGLCTDQDIVDQVVKNYEITDNNKLLGVVELPKIKAEDVADGNHTYGITAVYGSGEKSETKYIDVPMIKNESAYVPVDSLDITVGEDLTAHIKWQAPLNDDETKIHWGNMTPSQGFILPESLHGYLAASVYPVTMTAPYAGEYEITHLYYCPTAEAKFTLTLDDFDGNVITTVEGTDPKLGEINYVKLPEPITVDGSINYQLSVAAYAASPFTAPLAWDSSNKWKDGYSNIIDYGYGPTFLSEILQVGENPNWFMGLVIRQKNAKPMPIEGYNVLIDGVKVNGTPITATEYTTISFTEGTSHKAEVDVVYTTDKTVQGKEHQFEASVHQGIADITLDTTCNDKIFDLQGRRVVTDKMGRGVYIFSGKKVMK